MITEFPSFSAALNPRDLAMAMQHPTDELDAAFMGVFYPYETHTSITPPQEQAEPQSANGFASRLSKLHFVGLGTIATGALIGGLYIWDKLPFTASPASAAEPPIPTLPVIADCDPAYVNGQNWSNVRMYVSDSKEYPIDPERLGTKTKIRDSGGQTVVIGVTEPGELFPEIHLNTFALAVTPPQPGELESMFLHDGEEHMLWAENLHGEKLAETAVTAEEGCHRYQPTDDVLKLTPPTEIDQSDSDEMTGNPLERVRDEIRTTTGSHAE